MTASQIMECFLYVKLIEMGIHKDDIWEFSSSLRTAEAKNAFGLGTQFYRSELKWTKEMRNHIHLQSPVGISDADYAVFESIDVLNRIKNVLNYFLQRALKMPGAELKSIFYFLAPTKEFIHSKNNVN